MKESRKVLSNMIIKTISIPLLITSYLFCDAQTNQNSVKIPYKIIYAIAAAERSVKRDIGYPFIIGLNIKTDIKKVTSILPKEYLLNSRAIDCKNQNTCVEITNVLLKHKIINLDLGAFQINYKYHKLPIKDYFNLKTSYTKAEQIVAGHIKRYGYNLRAIANYHSKTRSLNKAYQDKLRYYLD